MESAVRPYHPANIKMTGNPYWRMVVLAWVAKLLDIQFHVQGLPFGGAYRGPAGGPNSMAFGMQAGANPLQPQTGQAGGFHSSGPFA